MLLGCPFGPLQAKPTPIRIPFQYVQSFIILDVKLHQLIPLKLIFDTGAEHTIFFERRWTDLFSNAYQREIKVIGSDLQLELPARLSVPMNLSFSDRFSFDGPLIVLEQNLTNISQVIGQPIHGILSANVFNGYLIEIDYRKHLIILHPHPWEVPKDYTAMDIQVYKGKPYLKTKIQLSHSAFQDVNLLLDTGASLSLLMYRDSSSHMKLPDKVIPGYLGSGLGGMLTGYVGRIQRINMDSFILYDVFTHILDIESDIGKNEKLVKNGLLGNQILEKFSIIFDFQHAKVYLKANKNFDKPMNYDKSGLVIISGGKDLQEYYLANVMPGSPAAEAGLHPDDQLLSINGIPAGFLSLGSIQSKLQKEEGKRITLKVRRGGKKYKFQFLLKSLI